MQDNPVPAEKYSAFHRLLHWLMALIIVGMIVIGWYMSELPREDPLRGQLYGLHFSFGVTLFALAVLRLLTRAVGHVPPPLPALAGWEVTVSRVNYFLMYLLMLAVPVLGYLTVSTVPDSQGVSVFGLFSLPPLTGPDKELHETFETLHGYGAWTLATLIALHVLGALKHRYLDGPEADVLPRMM